MKIRKIDVRNAVHGMMTYQVKLHYREAEKFWLWFEWCCNTWHTPVEYHSVGLVAVKLNKTAWTYRVPTDLNDYFELYLRGDEELALFQLRWQDV